MPRFGRSRPRAVLPLGELTRSLDRRRDTQLGALARSLATAERLGLVVPETWVVVADAFRHVVHTALPPGHDPASLLRTIQRPAGVERAAHGRDRLVSVVLDTDLEREIDAAWRALSESAPWGIAVRASPLVADAGVARTAGLTSTELAVFTREDVGRAIRWAWSRALSESALSYLRLRRCRDLAVAVVLQPVVVPRLTATLLTDSRSLLGADPPPSGAGVGPERVAVAHAGLASSTVDVSCAEVVHFDVTGAVRSRRPPAPLSALVVRSRALTTEVITAEPLDAEHLAELAEIARRVESLGAVALQCIVPRSGEITVVDVESAHHAGAPGAGTALTLWGRAAVAEAPAEPLSPLSRQLLCRSILERTRRALGPRAPRSSRAGGAIALVAGRPYLNLSPLLEASRERDVEGAIGRIEIAGAQWTPSLVREQGQRSTLARAGLGLAQIVTEQRVLSDAVARFERETEQQRRWLAEMDLAILPDDALTTTLREVEGFHSRAEELLGAATAAVTTGHSLLASVLSGPEGSRSSFLAHALTAGADVVTSRPAAALCHVAAIARFDEPAFQRLEQRAVRSLADLSEGPTRRALEQFLGAYGDRGLAETELGSPRWAEDPAPVLAMVSAALTCPVVDPEVALSRARALADRRLAELEARLSFFETRLARDLAQRQRELIRLRERCRLRVAHGLAMMRIVALDVDRRIRRLDPTLAAESALLLTVDELADAVRSYRADLAPLVRARRADLEADRRARESLSVFHGVPIAACPARTEPALRGVAVSSGLAEGRVVRVGARLEGLERFGPGDVIVVQSLDLGYAPLFWFARAVVAELGTALSSSAVVARDAAAPVVTGVQGAWVRLRDGERVVVDGDRGVVECQGP